MRLIKIYNKKEDCCGCASCKIACTFQAITMIPDSEGFRYPSINQSLCTSCLHCMEVCPIRIKLNDSESFSQLIYAVKHRDEKVRFNSTSGGMFTALSDYILKQNGVVYGAAFDSHLKVCHIRAVSLEDRERMRGSKYVQSELKDTYLRVKKDLTEGRLVLFTGTPCQVAGLKSYLKNTDTSNLLLCDIICHGVPSNMIWKEYVKFVKAKTGEPLINHAFRTKENGWHSMASRNIFQSRTEYNTALTQIHMNLFLRNLILRPCCYQCQFSSFQRYSDITLGDFWGMKSSNPEYDDNKGVSLVFINTLHGNEIFEAVKDNLDVQPTIHEDCIQGNLIKPTDLPEERSRFWKDYTRHGYSYVAKKYAGYDIYNRILQSVIPPVKKLRIYQYIKNRLIPARRR